jgi:response regulator RpfG family c-di-GMP phosphodiesterase
MITLILGGVLALTILFLASAILHIGKIQNELKEIDKEQHAQNKEIMDLMRRHTTHQEMLLQHIEILKYLVEQDPQLNSNKMYFSGPMGEA